MWKQETPICQIGHTVCSTSDRSNKRVTNKSASEDKLFDMYDRSFAEQMLNMSVVLRFNYIKMIHILRIFAFLLLLTTVGFLFHLTYKNRSVSYISFTWELDAVEQHSKKNTLEDFLSCGTSIIFLETSDRLQLPPLVLCAIESAARVYPDRPVIFFMKGLNHTNSSDHEEMPIQHFPTLSSLHNIHIFPLVMEDIFNNTPLFPWYMKINATQESHWLHVSADGCRLALIWKYGGIYMDTDIISVHPIPHLDFLAGESNQFSSNGVFGFSSRHNFTWTCMENFVRNYNSRSWGNQGPYLFTRVLKTICTIPNFEKVKDVECGNITFLNPQRFYPISYGAWAKYYEVWDKLPTFNDSYALHLWNYMNHISSKHRTMVPGSNTLIEHLYQQHCPSTYEALVRNVSTFI
ncbi:alpha-1,4-N-acetylglucosaminyltransferase-like [Gastrophryne carolinensis]